jgi:hypothetical protein
MLVARSRAGCVVTNRAPGAVGERAGAGSGAQAGGQAADTHGDSPAGMQALTSKAQVENLSLCAWKGPEES